MEKYLYRWTDFLKNNGKELFEEYCGKEFDDIDKVYEKKKKDDEFNQFIKERFEKGVE